MTGPASEHLQEEGTPKLESLFRPWWPPILIGGALFALLLVSTANEPPIARLVALALACFFAGMGLWCAAYRVYAENRSAKRAGATYRVMERHFGHVVTLFFDNPAMGRNEAIRRALLPSDDDLELLGLHPSFQKTLRDMRNGTSWMLLGGAHGGESLRIFPRGPASHPHFNDSLPGIPRKHEGKDAGSAP